MERKLNQYSERIQGIIKGQMGHRIIGPFDHYTRQNLEAQGAEWPKELTPMEALKEVCFEGYKNLDKAGKKAVRDVKHRLTLEINGQANKHGKGNVGPKVQKKILLECGWQKVQDELWK